MKYGVLGDLHANLSALEVVLADLDRVGVDALLSVGDVVGYGAAPAACIDLLRARGALTVKGNHDAAVVRELDDRYFNNYAREAVRWTQANLDRERKDWLAALPLTLELEHCHLSHGTLFRPELFDYILSTTDADPSLNVMVKPMCFVGHSHVPIALLRLVDAPKRTAYSTDPEIDLADAARCLLNVGSVGQPRDENPRTGYAVYDTEARRAWLTRLPYDIEREAARIRTAGLPDVLAERLKLGV
jgi:diadenosine tetraphosphatase ApaH/serine/threonine PP2A family protein phosphatase